MTAALRAGARNWHMTDAEEGTSFPPEDENEDDARQ